MKYELNRFHEIFFWCLCIWKLIQVKFHPKNQKKDIRHYILHENEDNHYYFLHCDIILWPINIYLLIKKIISANIIGLFNFFWFLAWGLWDSWCLMREHLYYAGVYAAAMHQSWFSEVPTLNIWYSCSSLFFYDRANVLCLVLFKRAL